MLFNILTVDLNEDLRKGRWGGMRIRGKICLLTYAEAVEMLAEMESIARRLKGKIAVKNRIEKKTTVNDSYIDNEQIDHKIVKIG